MFPDDLWGTHWFKRMFGDCLWPLSSKSFRESSAIFFDHCVWCPAFEQCLVFCLYHSGFTNLAKSPFAVSLMSFLRSVICNYGPLLSTALNIKSSMIFVASTLISLPKCCQNLLLRYTYDQILWMYRFYIGNQIYNTDTKRILNVACWRSIML